MINGQWLTRKLSKSDIMWSSNHLYLIIKFLPFIAIYIIGLNGIGLYSVIISLILGVASFYCPQYKTEISKRRRISAAWIQDNDWERAEWINDILANLWPHFEKLLENFSSESLLIDSKFLILRMEIKRLFIL